MQVYLFQDEQQVGPYSLDQIRELIALGKVTDDTPSWHEGLPGWVSISSLMSSITKPVAAPPLPNPPEGRPNKSRLTGRFILITLFLIVLAVGFIGIAEVCLEGRVREISTPQDPGTHQVFSGAFTVVQVLSPGRALAQKSYGMYSNMVHSLSDAGVGYANPDQMYLLAGIPTTLVDGDTWKGEVFENGIFSYTATDNSSKTVRSLVAVDLEAEKIAQQKRVIEEQAVEAARKEKEFADDIQEARLAISSGDSNKAATLLEDASLIKPNDQQLLESQTQLKRAQFEAVVKSYDTAIASGNISTSIAQFNQAKELLPNDPSLSSLQVKMDGLKDHFFQEIDSKLQSLDISGADKDYADLAGSFPEESRLVAYKAKIVKVKFDMVAKSFHQAIQSQDIDVASAKFNEASALIPNEASLNQMQSDLAEATFGKGSNALKTFLANTQFNEAKKEMSKLRALNIEHEQANALATQLTTGIKTAISSTVSRGKNALSSNNVDLASQALVDAAGLDSTNADVLSLQELFSVKGQWDKVVPVAEKAHDSDPDNTDAT